MVSVGDWETTIKFYLDPERATRVISLLRRPEVPGMIGLSDLSRSRGEITWHKSMPDEYCRDSQSAAFQAQQQLWDRWPASESRPTGEFTVTTKWVPR